VRPAMDERDRQFRRETWADLDRGWTTSFELLTATGVWMGIGWLLDRWLETSPWFLACGAVLGFALGTYLIFLRAEEQGRAEEAKRPRL
jgi:ATP synthase protein I